jgi:high-affinity Fe2+/Pb2+ permease
MVETKYFNPIPLFILFREAIEASIVVSVLLTFINKINLPQLKKQGDRGRTARKFAARRAPIATRRSRPLALLAVWWGVVAGIGISLILVS